MSHSPAITDIWMKETKDSIDLNYARFQISFHARIESLGAFLIFSSRQTNVR
jgi:hypothetical protein